MRNELEPVVGGWYRQAEEGQTFRVVAVDEDSETIEIQHLDGEVEEIDFYAWPDLELEVTEEPEDWTEPDEGDEDDEDDEDEDERDDDEEASIDEDEDEDVAAPLSESRRRSSGWKDDDDDDDDDDRSRRGGEDDGDGDDY